MSTNFANPENISSWIFMFHLFVTRLYSSEAEVKVYRTDKTCLHIWKRCRKEKKSMVALGRPWTCMQPSDLCLNPYRMSAKLLCSDWNFETSVLISLALIIYHIVWLLFIKNCPPFMNIFSWIKKKTRQFATISFMDNSHYMIYVIQFWKISLNFTLKYCT